MNDNVIKRSLIISAQERRSKFKLKVPSSKNWLFKLNCSIDLYGAWRLTSLYIIFIYGQLAGGSLVVKLATKCYDSRIEGRN